jgi:aerobic-type carbon monoxide dehydrogenase small subunit (CoxS/CutS family)
MASIELRVNGDARRTEGGPDRPLLWVLRDELDLTGSKYGCGEGRCGACTVLIDGNPTRSCVTSVGDCAARPIITIEGLAKGEKLHPLQQAFLDVGAMQCGYCTPGMIVAGAALLEKNRAPSLADISKALEGNVCRCGTYARIAAAIRQAGQAMMKEDNK